MINQKFECKAPEQLPAIAQKLIATGKLKGIVAFYGAMGAGKTTLIKEICHQSGVDENVSSPTFSLVNEYMTDKGETIYHFDFYRIKNIDEALDMGVEEYFGSGNLCLIEWPEKIEQLLDTGHTVIRIDVAGNNRMISIQ